MSYELLHSNAGTQLQEIPKQKHYVRTPIQKDIRY